MLVQFVANERKLFSSNEEFWARWSDSKGRKIGYQAIANVLKGDRKDDFARNANLARSFFRENSDHPQAHTFFTYMKGGKPVPYRNDKRGDKPVAKKWQEFIEANSNDVRLSSFLSSVDTVDHETG